MGRQVTLNELAEVTGYTVQTLIRWQQQEGMPAILTGQRGVGNAYDTQQIINWLIAREIAKRGASNPLDRKNNAQADEIELRIAERVKLLAPVAELEYAWTRHVLAARTELLRLPETLAAEIHSSHGVRVAPELIQTHVEAALAKLEQFDDDADHDPDQRQVAEGDADDGEGDD